MRFLATIVFACVFFGSTSASKAASQYVDSVLAAIDSANGQARLDLKKGFYRAVSGANRMVLEIPNEMGSTLKFIYQNRSLRSASWEFSNFVFVNLTVAGKCVRIKVKRLDYGEGGFVEGGNEDIVPTGPCRESEPLTRLNDFLRLSPDPGDFFRGAAFIAIGGMKRCTDAGCSSLTSGLPVRRATFFGSVAPDGTPLSALAARFKEGSRIILPRNGMLALAAGSDANFDDLTYDLESTSGTALLHQFRVVVSDGIISGGQTVIRLKPQTSFTAEEVKFDKDDASVRISRGSIGGELGEGTSILLTNDVAKTSTLNIRYAKAAFTGLTYIGSQASTSLSFQRGILSVQLENAELWFSDRNSIRVGYTNLNLVLGCPESANTDTCTPVSWNKDGLAVYGTIGAFSTTLTGGQFNISNAGLVQLRGGQIAADTLQIESRNKTSPITGKINKFEISLEAQDFHIDGATIAKIARADVKAYDLVYKTGESLPIGTVAISGSASGIEAGKIGKVKFDAGAAFDLKIDRRDGDEPELTEGNIDGNAKAAMDGGSVLTAALHIEKLRYYRGHGDAILRLTATAAEYTFYTPPDHTSASKLGFSADIDVKSIKLTPTLISPVVLGPTAVKASQASWTIDPVVGVPFKFRVPIAQQELVYAPIKSPVGGTVCAPKVMLAGQTPDISGKLDVFASSAGGKIRIYDGALSAGIDASVDDRGCDQIADLVCFLVGTAFGGPIGGAALACICNSNLQDAKAKLSNQVRDESIRKVTDSKFNFNY